MIRRTLHYYWQTARKYKKLYWIVFPLITIATLSGSIGYFYILSLIIEALTQLNDASPARLWMLFAWLVALAVTEFLTWRIQGFIYSKLQAMTLRDLEQMVFKRLMNHSYSFYVNRFSGAIVTQFNRFVRSYEHLEDVFAFEFYGMLLRILVSSAVLLILAPWIGLSLIIWTIVFTSSVAFISYKKMPITKKASAADSKVTGDIADSITNILNVKTFARKRHERKRFAQTSQDRFIKRVRSWFFDEYIRAYQSFLMTAFQVFLVYLSIRFVLDGSLSISVLLLAQLYTGRIFADLWNLQHIIRRMESAFSDATEMTRILDTPSGVIDPKSPEKLKITDGKIEFRNVSFSYSEKDQSIFEHFSMHISAGEKIGLVGHSGGGKTTLTKLLLRFLDISNGQILIDGQNIANLLQEDLRSQIAYVPQEPILFHRSLIENILYGRLDATDTDIRHVADMAYATEFIEKLPEKYNTLVGERGIKLSAGQKQRIAIARAMLSKAPILVLDEATSSLDSKSEKLISEALENLMKNRTTIVIAHRLSTIQKMDRILVLDKGKIAESGSHLELVQKHGLYAELWQHQSGGFLKE
jgi:ATP-binding cassette, subfamily B, bacterial